MGQSTFYPEQDTFLQERYPTTIGGADVGGRVGMAWDEKDGDFACRGLLHFDVSLLIGETVEDTTKLRLYMWQFWSQEDLYVRRCTRADWDEDFATWNRYKELTDWTTPGGDRATPRVDNAGPTGIAYWFEIAGVAGNLMSTLVQDALDNRAGQLHIIIEQQQEAATGSEGFTFRTKEYDGGSVKPELVVDYVSVGAKNYYTGGFAAGKRLTRGLGF